MPLDNKDLKNIRTIVKNIVVKSLIANNELLEAKWDKRFDRIERRLDDNDRQHDIINKKLDRVVKTEHEDIMALSDDIDGVKIRLTKVGL